MRMSSADPDSLWGIDRVSAYLNIPKSTLYGWRTKKKGPRASRMGRHLRYDYEDVLEWKRLLAAQDAEAD